MSALVAVALVGAYLLTRDGGSTTTTTAAPTPTAASATAIVSASRTPSATPTLTPTPSASASASVQGTRAKRPPTLAFRVTRDSYITVRVPGGRTLVSRLFEAGERGRFDQRRLEVVNGRPSAVRFVVNGEPRPPGEPTEPETFTVRR